MSALAVTTDGGRFWVGAQMQREEVDAEEPFDDAALIRRVAAGNESAFRLLATRHLPRITRLAEKMMGSTGEADDIAQEALVRIWQNAGRFDPERARLGTWIHRIVYNLCIDRLRRPRNQPIEAAEAVPDDSPSGFETVSRRQELGRLRKALSLLPERQRAAVVLFYYEELAGQAAADSLGLSLRAFWSLLHRARQALQQAVAPGEGGPG